ncbi:SMP-30/gluconolactonase/LRE family protein [Sphingobium sp. Sx8-8]|uniref:SMP-30/gluconolactonase/LRE family protein n=1 Tax=Sphingobium sp. Sx8-8 TaxID=2933617 RepID=UPI001F589F2B|nr:SMP-30/gluconolactonase/LRE family protein [Sphingobium sp. Sx8-8]
MSEHKVIATGLRFPEGPIWRPDGSILLVEMERQTLSRVASDGGVEVVAHLGGGPNGAAIGPDGHAYVCNNGGFLWHEEGPMLMPHGRAPDCPTGSIQRVDLSSGTVDILYTHCDGQPLLAPNDIAFDCYGGFWFTDSGLMTETGMTYGGLYYAKQDGSGISKVRGGNVGLNGVAFGPDGTTLYVSETLAGRLWAFDIVAPGEAAPPPMPFMAARIVQTLPAFQMVDSLAVEASGKVAVATMLNGGITIFDPDGTTEHFPLPDPFMTNICFGGADMQDAWMTGGATGTLFAARWPRPGLALPYN